MISRYTALACSVIFGGDMFEIFGCDGLSIVYVEQDFCIDEREQGRQGRHKPENHPTNGEFVARWSEESRNAFNSMMWMHLQRCMRM